MVYDVIVVGSGPAGSAAATCLAQRGVQVLLVDREQFPREKSCGDLIGPRSLAGIARLGAANAVLNNLFPLDKVIVATKGVNAIAYDLPHPGPDGFGVIPRYTLDNLLRSHAVECGAQFQTLQVKQLARSESHAWRVLADEAGIPVEIEARLVIGADGASSVVARQLGWKIKREKDRGVALRAYVPFRTPGDRTGEVHFLKRLLPGYAWAFPVNETTANIGIGLRADRYLQRKSNLKAMLDEFLSLPVIRERYRVEELNSLLSWSLNFASAGGRRSFDGALLAGDAGSFVDPFAGAGIHAALITGWLAGETATEALQSGDLSAARLAAYDRRWQKALGKDFWILTFLQRSLAHMPWLLDLYPHIGYADNILLRYLLGKL